MARETPKRKKRSPLFLLLLVALALGVFGYARFLEPNLLLVKEAAISSSRINGTADGLRILVFADTHFGPHYTVSDFQKVVDAAAAAEPDIVFFLGDLIDHFHRYDAPGGTDAIAVQLAAIPARYGKYAVFGNHDYGGGAESVYPAVMEAGGFTLLVNQTVFLPELDLTITGIDDVVIGYGDPTAAAAASGEGFTIVATHAPDVADQLAPYPSDLVLAGHTHGRQVALKVFDPYILPPYGRNYVKGLYDLPGDRSLYVTAGLGTTQLPLRFGSVPELTIITLDRT